MNLSTSQQRTLLSTATFAAIVMLIGTAAEFAIQTWPLKFGELNWRVGSFGLFLDALAKSIPGLALLYFAAALSDSRKVLKTLGFLAILLGVLAIPALGMFALDGVQMRATLPQQAKGVFTKVALRAALMGTLSAILFISTGLRTLKVLKSGGAVRAGGTRPAETDDNMLMIARPAAPARPNLTAIKGDEPVKVVEA